MKSINMSIIFNMLYIKIYKKKSCFSCLGLISLARHRPFSEDYKNKKMYSTIGPVTYKCMHN